MPEDRVLIFKKVTYNEALNRNWLQFGTAREDPDGVTRVYSVENDSWWDVPEDDAAAGRMQELPKDMLTTTNVLTSGLKTTGQSKVDGERQEQHGDPVPNMERFAGFLSAYFGIKVTAHDAAWVQGLFKIVRSKANPSHTDNYDDLEGYTEIARRCAGIK